ncbi:hypothetical protein COW36_17365 [bacterium (Candidatus Blackallbacteria) CG17_big_fil_post_rev_8_21_14_2_50_48_46]|uniref:Uncharacterized protein n=1 Tax=bacterium (Candidatus Blackallbacteria) CG17_big_fil_post_rev_8_21_14_2_50_48_46 TaxID=2014261 RepID=A0A2M7G0E9_9BACT|nr:MAG: hypothetical protein COW64_01365 [bacterium (Candidatus Blackallbacteria) CG18_big_fil_WC_8_21_14_2_50_49_26]PIW15191.1 MAG: hypothetical protein COW36_17365 [bacterium (Candidatus Blackallbacteria) CG17_big_fil_post_rev_8_21_14_2_50_48_46]PIW44778.1 MAG: hypothetical protein COW20_22700 [bacterium (Candidatus Blackallbacteria) CG13_big_fil_rev_8_21_14_2_50_49_14]
MTASENRSEAWKNLFAEKGWLKQNQIHLPSDIRVYLYFPPATTDINSIQSICLEHDFSTTDDFIIYRISPNEEEYYLWEDIQSIRITTQRKMLRGS